MRRVILHYHLFKNAGTSLDAAFKENFKGDEWVTKEFPAQPAKNREQVAQWILDNPQAKCFSSHTAILPPPNLEGVKIFPVIFVRHPIDRIVSAYTFEKKQGGDSFGAVLARNTTLAGYIESRLALKHDRQCRNFHVHFLSTMFGANLGTELERSKMAIEQLPLVGLVEEYNNSLSCLEKLLIKEGFNNIKLKPVERNVSRKHTQSLDENLAELFKNIGEILYDNLFHENACDFDLYRHILENFKRS